MVWLNYIWPVKEMKWPYSSIMVVGWVKQALVNLVMLIQAMYLAKKVQIKKIYKSYSATWVLIWNVILGSFCTNFATWMTPFLYQFCNLKSVTSWFWRYLDCNRDTFDLNDLDHISIRIWAQPNSSTDFFF